MGCDIHIIYERRSGKSTNKRWVGVWASDHLPYDRRPVIAQRDYQFFAEVAGVRGSTPTCKYAKGAPEDISELGWQEYMAWSTDAHHISHMSATDFVAAYIHANGKDEGKTWREEHAMYDLLKIEGDAEPRDEHRVVFWFDN